jgi:hypothetical protein
MEMDKHRVSYKAKDGSGDKIKIIAEVGSFQVTLTAPSENSSTMVRLEEVKCCG